MNSEAPKVLHELCGRPMLWYVVHACRSAGAAHVVVVVGYGKDEVIAAFDDQKDIIWIEQAEQKGTAHAALVCEGALRTFDGPILTVAGDMPLIRRETLEKLVEELARSGDAVTLATCVLDDPYGYGRIVREGSGALVGIVEERDCTPEQRRIREVNVSYYCFDGARMFRILKQIDCNNAKGEFYITDAVSIARASGFGAGAIPAVPAEDALGINSRSDLAIVGRIMQNRIQTDWMNRGVTIIDPASTWIETGATIGKDAVIYPFSYIGDGAVIGEGCIVGPHGYFRAGDVIASPSTAGPELRVGARP